MLKKVNQTVTKYNLLQEGECVVVALSGGPDSTALLTLLAEIAQKMDLKIVAAHFNHGLRGKESDEDEDCSRNLAEKLGVIFVAGKMGRRKKEKGVSPEDFYRSQRYSFLDKVAKDYQAQKVALGHNRNDQAETVLLNILRGSGLEGLKGFLPIRDGKFIRPLMDVSRQEIISFLKKNKIPYRTDSSNKEKIYLRNKIRKGLIPYIKDKYNPKIEENLAQMAEILRGEDEFMHQCVVKALQSPCVEKNPRMVSLNLVYINKINPAIRLRLLKTILEDLSSGKKGISFIHVKALNDLIQKGESGKRLVFPAGVEARREYDKIVLEKKKKKLGKTEYEYALKIPGSVNIKERGLIVTVQKLLKKKVDISDSNRIYLDLDTIKKPLVIRNRREGDWFHPLGTQGRQKIKNLYINNKISRIRRDEIMLLVDDLSVIWVENMHLSDRVKITPETRNILKLEIGKP
jgi:tRNA(Ile)-lysidine synthase